MVGESAHVTVVAAFNPVRVALAELDLILLRVVKLFYPVVSFRALISHGALVAHGSVGHIGTDLGGVGAQGPSPVLLELVVEEALFGVVLQLQLAGLRLEVCQVDELHGLVFRGLATGRPRIKWNLSRIHNICWVNGILICGKIIIIG